MAILRRSEPWAMTAERAAQRRGYRAQAELALRNALEAWCRERWPEARICHEMVIGEGKTRADVVAIAPDHIAAFEVKGDLDDTTRLLHQVGMFQLAVPEVWMVVAEAHDADGELIRHLLPSVGLMVGEGLQRRHGLAALPDPDVRLTVRAESMPRVPVPRATLEMLWADELRWIGERLDCGFKSRSTRAAMIQSLLARAEYPELRAMACAALRGRDALWRADPPVESDGGRA